MTGIIKNNKSLTKSIIKPNGLIKAHELVTYTTYRYLYLQKTNIAADFHYHTELKILNNNVESTITAGMISSVGYVVYANENLVDNNIATYWGHSSTTNDNSYIKIDFGEGNEQPVDKVRLYIVPDASVTQDAPIYNILASHDDIIKTILATGFDCSGGAGWKEITW